MLQHLLFLPCTPGQLLKSDGAFTNWSQRVVPLLFLVTKIQLLCFKICSYLTADYFLPDLPNFSLFFLEAIQNTAAKPLPMFTLTELYLNITSQPPGVFWSPSLLGPTEQQCPMCCQHGLLVGLCPALAFPSDFSYLDPAPPFLATSSPHSCCPGMSLCLAVSSGISLAFENIQDSTLKILHIPITF